MSYLGIELGSTRIKAMTIDENFTPVSSGEYSWKSRLCDGYWTYDLNDVWMGLNASLAQIEGRNEISAMGISAMMHGYLAFDCNWNLLVPFRTWQNTTTAEASEKLTEVFHFNIPQRYSIAHLYQALLCEEPHVKEIAHITTLAGYIHYRLTGRNVVGIGEASGMFPVDGSTKYYDETMLQQFDELAKDQPWQIRDLLPEILVAGCDAGALTEEGAELLHGNLKPGIRFAPPEGDAGTGMVATNAVAKRTGNVSAGTSIFSMVVLERPLAHVYPEIDLVTTPSGDPVAMVHCNNCTTDMNAWVALFSEVADLFGADVDAGAMFEALYRKSLEGSDDCDGITVCNYMAGEGVTHLDEGRPFVVRRPDADFSLANFMRAQIYSTMATLSVGMELLHKENVQIDRLMGHGGIFKTKHVAQRYLAAACQAPISCMETAGEGGPYGMALLAAYLHDSDKSLEAFLGEDVFCHCKEETLLPLDADVKGFSEYAARFQKGLSVEKAAIEAL